MINLSLTPRFDLFKFCLPKDFIPEELEEKYFKLFQDNPSVHTSPIDYINESIQGVSFPGINELVVTQPQHGYNPLRRSNTLPSQKINIEPRHEIVYKSSENLLDKIEREVKITFRLNQGFYNYFMLYEIIFYKYCKHIDETIEDVLCLDILNEQGTVITKIYFYDVYINGISGLELDYTKDTRTGSTFDITFKYNNINFDFITHYDS